MVISVPKTFAVLVRLFVLTSRRAGTSTGIKKDLKQIKHPISQNDSMIDAENGAKEYSFVIFRVEYCSMMSTPLDRY